MKWPLVKVVFLHWVLQGSVKHFNKLLTCAQESFCYLCSQHRIKVYHDAMMLAYQENKKQLLPVCRKGVDPSWKRRGYS